MNPQRALENRADSESTMRNTLDSQPPIGYPWPLSLRQYVQRAFYEGNATRGIEHHELREKLKAVVTGAAESGYLHTTDWSAYPLPQDIIIQEREKEALYYTQDAVFDNVDEPAPPQHQHEETTTLPPAPASSSPNADVENQAPSRKPNKADYKYRPSPGVFVCHLLMAIPPVLVGPLVILNTCDPPLRHNKTAVMFMGYLFCWVSYIGSHTISKLYDEHGDRPYAKSLLSSLVVLLCALNLSLYLGPFDI